MIELTEKAQEILNELGFIVPVLQTTESITIHNDGQQVTEDMIHQFASESQLKETSVMDLRIFTICPVIQNQSTQRKK